MGEDIKSTTPPPASTPTPAPKTATSPPAGNTPAQGPTTGQTTGKKSNLTMIIIIIVAVLVVLSVGGYFVTRYLARKASEKVTEKILEGATGNKVDINSSNTGATYKTQGGEMSVGTKAQWPSDTPSSLPEFTFGTMASVSTSGEVGSRSWTMGYEKVATDAYTKYKDLLLQKGWKITSETTYGTTSGLMAELEGYQVTFSVYSDSAEAGLTVNNK